MVRKKLTVYTALCGLLLSLVTLVAPAQPARAASSPVPGQFIAKQYTEIFGRLPDQSGWKWLYDVFRTQGCNEQTLVAIGKNFLNSAEFQNLQYPNEIKVMVLYRSILNREPDQGGLVGWTNHLNQGMSWQEAQQHFYATGEFKSLIPRICNGTIDAQGASYYFAGQAPNLSVQGTGFTGDETQLQTALNDATTTNGTVNLAQKAVVRLTKPLVIPANVTLTTTGQPSIHQYGLQARIVRAAGFDDALIKLQGGAKLEHVWVDGARNEPANYHTARVNVQMLGGNGTTVRNNRIVNSQGWSNVTAHGSAEAQPACQQNVISGNMITAYSADHHTGNYTDGLSVSCENTLIENNQIVDTTDVGIVLFKSSGPLEATVTQRSIARNNHIFAAGNSMFAAMGFDPLYQTDGRPTLTYDFTGAAFTSNTYWTSPATHFDIAITNGSRAWFGGRTDIAANYGKGAIVSNNKVGLFARVQSGTATSGMLQTQAQDTNAAAYRFITKGTCPKSANVAAISAGHASGTFGPSVVDRSFDNCIAAH